MYPKTLFSASAWSTFSFGFFMAYTYFYQWLIYNIQHKHEEYFWTEGFTFS